MEGGDSGTEALGQRFFNGFPHKLEVAGVRIGVLVGEEIGVWKNRAGEIVGGEIDCRIRRDMDGKFRRDFASDSVEEDVQVFQSGQQTGLKGGSLLGHYRQDSELADFRGFR